MNNIHWVTLMYNVIFYNWNNDIIKLGRKRQGNGHVQWGCIYRNRKYTVGIQKLQI